MVEPKRQALILTSRFLSNNINLQLQLHIQSPSHTPPLIAIQSSRTPHKNQYHQDGIRNEKRALGQGLQDDPAHVGELPQGYDFDSFCLKTVL
jgi:hypothetical protein